MREMDRREFVRHAGVVGLLGVAAPVFAAASIKPDAKSALLVIDVQNCFIPGGTLPVKDGEQVVPIINKLSGAFENVVVTQDWHTAGHVSFASAHPGMKPFSATEARLRHAGALARPLRSGLAGRGLAEGPGAAEGWLIIRKGYHQSTDSYSAFMEADGKMPRPAWPRTSRRTASTPSTSAAWRPTSASPGRRSTRARPASRPTSSRTRHAASTSTARSPRPGTR